MAVVYGCFDPSVAPFPRCAFHTLTGYDCPGCGSQRALHALFGGNLRQAWAFNPLLVVALLALPFYAAAEWWADRWPRLSRTLRGRRACLVLAAVIVVWWIVRNII